VSIKYKIERAFHNALADAASERDLQILTSQMVGWETVRPRRIIIAAITGSHVSPKARNLRMNVMVIVERIADDADDDPDDETAPVNHALNVDAVHEVLDNTPGGLARLLTSQNTTPGVSGFTCFGVVPMGEVHEPPNQRERSLRDTFGYVCTVCESDNS